MKTRLIGALVLIALAVIFVPMLLPGGSGNRSQAGLKVPPQPSGELQTRVLQVGPDSAAAGPDTHAAVVDPDHVATLDLEKQPHAPVASLPAAPVIEPTMPPPASAPGETPAPAAHAPGPAKVQAPAANAPQPAKVPPASPASGTAQGSAATVTHTAYPMPPLPGGAGAAAGAIYTVNLGIYADHASADKLVASARQHGFTAVATPETFEGKQVLRVRVGPYRSRAEAEAARLKLKGIENVPMRVDSTVMAQAGDAPAAAIAPAQAGAWAVQLAAFSDEASANKLRDRLRALDFDGYVDSVKNGQHTWWRVRAGPFTSRDVATEARARIADKLKIKGNIVTQE